MRVQWDAGNRARELRPAAIHNPLLIRGIRRAQHGKGNTAVPKCRARELPAVERDSEFAVLNFQRQFVNVLTIQVVPDVVVTRSVVASEPSGQGRENSSCGELEESAV